MYADQLGKCSICKKDIPFDGKNCTVDHCHKIGKVRGLLCGKCNLGIGHFDDDTQRLSQAIEYLEASND